MEFLTLENEIAMKTRWAWIDHEEPNRRTGMR
jgi:hypothetical protein